MTDIKGRSPRDPNPWYRGSKRYGDLGRHAPPGDELENTRDHERIWWELANMRRGGDGGGPFDPWIPPVYVNGWHNAGSPFLEVAYHWDGTCLEIMGHATGGVSGTIAFYLDTDHRPTGDLSTATDIVRASPGIAQIYIESVTGAVRLTRIV